MRIHYIQHASFEPIGVIEEWAKARKFSLTGAHVYKGERLLTVEDFDMLIVMGGPQSPREIDQYPYLQDEIDLIKASILEEKIILGFCLGAQLIGEALGASTLKSPNKEVGIYPITLTKGGREDSLFEGFPNTFNVIHWHNDMPGLKEGMELLAYSEGCPHQAFRYGSKIYGLQFHMEITLQVAKDLLDYCPEDLRPDKYIQSPEVLMAQDFKSINQNMVTLLDRLCARQHEELLLVNKSTLRLIGETLQCRTNR